ncbi:MAG TPA: hypothetical protein VKN18_00600 [Blastocatellia bacterium]|nr:hypothetical protein [Blastocatellia bacterium]
MTAYATSPHQLQSPSESGTQQFTPEERDKLQEIHELINLLLRELPLTAHARSTAFPILPAGPYGYSVLRFPCG